VRENIRPAEQGRAIRPIGIQSDGGATSLRLAHHTHSAAELLDDAIVRDGLADRAEAMLGALQWEVNDMRIACV
jgi:hypothetical protein